MRARATATPPLGALLVGAAVAAAGAGCSLVTSFDGVVLGDGGAFGGAESGPDDATDVSDVGLAGDTGGEVGAQDAGDAQPAGDAGREADVDAAICFANRTYCGSEIGRTATNLYQCTADGGALVQVRTCSHGCIQRAGGDLCSCIDGGLYCGDDQVMGPNSKWLYTCGPNDQPVLKQMCPNGCTVNVSTDDSCY
jgi:hypothetical protein